MPVPDNILAGLDPSARASFMVWSEFLKERVNFSFPDSNLHGALHTERVLLYAIILGGQIFHSDTICNEILAHASVFHDTRRMDDSYDVGHGARASIYYKQFCHDNGFLYYPEAATIMRFHDTDDAAGLEMIKKEFDERSQMVSKLYKVFKDADALDRWRLGPHGLDERYLRTPQSKKLVKFSFDLVKKIRNSI